MAENQEAGRGAACSEPYAVFTHTRQLWTLLSRSLRKKVVANFVLSPLSSVLEVGGIALMLPAVTLLLDPKSIANFPRLAFLHSFGNQSQVERALTVLAGLFFVVLIVREVLALGLRYLTAGIQAETQREFSEMMMDAYLRQPYEWFAGRNSSQLGQNVLERASSLSYSVFGPLTQIVRQGVMAILLVSGLVALSPALALASLLSVTCVLAVFHRIIAHRLESLGRDVFDEDNHQHLSALETFQGIKEAKFRRAESHFLGQYRDSLRRSVSYQLKQQIYHLVPSRILRILVVLTFGSLAFFVFLTGSSILTLPKLLLFGMIILRLVPTLQAFPDMLWSYRDTKPLLDALLADLDAGLSKPELKEQQLVPLAWIHSVHLRNVSFTYLGATRPSLAEVNLEIGKGVSLALVGRSGAGKTTLVDLLIGLLDPSQGAMTVDDQGDFDRAAWSANIGYCPQSPFLSDRDIAGNIAFGLPPGDICPQRLQQASRLSCLDEVVADLPAGLQSRIGERGQLLSQGQRQRIGIARALYQNPSLLILDESTSALDTLTEARILENLLAREGKTLILITHRLAAARQCETIAVLEGGRLAGMGTYDNLIENCEIFAKMVMISES